MIDLKCESEKKKIDTEKIGGGCNFKILIKKKFGVLAKLTTDTDKNFDMGNAVEIN